MVETLQKNRSLQIELQYLPSIAYMAYVTKFDTIWVDSEERYIKQSFRNRCQVLTSNKVDILSVPVKSYPAGCQTKDIRIDYSQNWIKRHWGCFQSAYGKSPYFEYYGHEFESVYAKRNVFLADLNYDMLTICLRLVGSRSELQYKLSGADFSDLSVINAVSAVNAKKGDENDKYYVPTAYYQTFGNDFVANLSIVDLLFNMGPEARSILLKSQK